MSHELRRHACCTTSASIPLAGSQKAVLDQVLARSMHPAPGKKIGTSGDTLGPRDAGRGLRDGGGAMIILHLVAWALHRARGLGE